MGSPWPLTSTGEIDYEKFIAYCPTCMANKPWKHDPDPAWLIRLRKVKMFFKGQWSLKFEWWMW